MNDNIDSQSETTQMLSARAFKATHDKNRALFYFLKNVIC